jgi:uncharacterized protein YlzI (FlbEa/FlbD family)
MNKIYNRINEDGTITVWDGSKRVVYDDMHTVAQAIELFIKYA